MSEKFYVLKYIKRVNGTRKEIKELVQCQDITTVLDNLCIGVCRHKEGGLFISAIEVKPSITVSNYDFVADNTCEYIFSKPGIPGTLYKDTCKSVAYYDSMANIWLEAQ